MKISARKRAKKRIQRDFFHDMILDSNESAIFALVIKTVYIKMAKVGYIFKENNDSFDAEREWMQIGRARVGKECRSRWSPYH